MCDQLLFNPPMCLVYVSMLYVQRGEPFFATVSQQAHRVELFRLRFSRHTYITFEVTVVVMKSVDCMLTTISNL